MSYDLMVFERTKAPTTKKNLWHGMKSKRNGRKDMITKRLVFLLRLYKTGFFTVNYRI